MLTQWHTLQNLQDILYMSWVVYHAQLDKSINHATKARNSYSVQLTLSSIYLLSPALTAALNRHRPRLLKTRSVLAAESSHHPSEVQSSVSSKFGTFWQTAVCPPTTSTASSEQPCHWVVCWTPFPPILLAAVVASVTGVTGCGHAGLHVILLPHVCSIESRGY